MSTRSKTAQRSPLPIILVLLLVLAAAYIGGWFFARSALMNGIEQQIEALRADGYQVDFADTVTEGFPFRVDVILTDPAVAAPPTSPAWSWSADALRVRLAPPAITQLEVLPEGPQQVRLPDAEPFELQAESPRIVVAADQRGLSHMGAESGPWSAIDVRSGDNIAAAGSFAIDVARAADSAARHDITGAMQQFQRAASGDKPANLSLDAALLGGEVFAAMGEVTPQALAAWADADGALDVTKLGVDWGEEGVDISGELRIADNGHWDGSMRLTAREPGAVVQQLSALGYIEPDFVVPVAAAAEAAAGDGGVLTAPFRVRDGALYFMGFPMGRVAPAF